MEKKSKLRIIDKLDINFGKSPDECKHKVNALIDEKHLMKCLKKSMKHNKINPVNSLSPVWRMRRNKYFRM